VVASARNSALAGLVAGSLASGSADPGIGFFVAFAVVAAARVQARRTRDAAGHWRQAPPSLLLPLRI